MTAPEIIRSREGGPFLPPFFSLPAGIDIDEILQEVEANLRARPSVSQVIHDMLSMPSQRTNLDLTEVERALAIADENRTADVPGTSRARTIKRALLRVLRLVTRNQFAFNAGILRALRELIRQLGTGVEESAPSEEWTTMSQQLARLSDANKQVWSALGQATESAQELAATSSAMGATVERLGQRLTESEQQMSLLAGRMFAVETANVSALHESARALMGVMTRLNTVEQAMADVSQVQRRQAEVVTALPPDWATTQAELLERLQRLEEWSFRNRDELLLAINQLTDQCRQCSALSTVQAEHLDRLERLEQWSFRTRDELFFEIHKAARQPTSSYKFKPSYETKAKAMPHGPRLNLGCGAQGLTEFINVDVRDLPEVDIVCDVREIPLPEATVSEIRASHLIEHFGQLEIRKDLLPRWHTLLKPGGRLTLVTPDWDAILRRYMSGQMSYDDLVTVTFGQLDYEGDAHHTMLTVSRTTELLQEAGFVDVLVSYSDRANGRSFDLCVEGRRPCA